MCTRWVRQGLSLAPTIAICLILAFAMAAVPLAAEEESFSNEALAMRNAARLAGVPEHELPLETPEESRINKARLESWERKISSPVRHVLSALQREGVQTPGGRRDVSRFSTPTVQVDSIARLLVECRVDSVERFGPVMFRSISGQLVDRAFGYGLLVAWIPATEIPAFANRPDVRRIRHIDPPYTDIGAVVTEGDAIHRADDARAILGVDGTGQLVGVISDGVSNLAFSQASGDLPPAPPAVPSITVPAGCTGSNDEGTAMLEIVWDLAPGADLAFCTGNPGSTGMINAINTLAALPGMTIITDDLPKPGEPLFEDGPIAQAKQAAEAAGIFYTASAGNRGNQHYEGNFNGPVTSVMIGGNTYANPHDFGGGDYQLSITTSNCGTPPCGNDVYLQWAELFGSAAIDLDLYILDGAGNVLASSTDPQTGTEDPEETVSFNAAAGIAANILVDYVGGGASPTVFFDLRSFSVGWNEYLVRAGSINGASRQAEVYAAGAAHWSTPATVRGFSSRGPIQRFFPAPTITRMKPDATAVDGVTVTGAGCFGCGAGCPPVPPGGCSFGGTSAATPHVAGMAALLLEDQTGLTTGQVADTFNTTAVDIDALGPDNNTGFGRLDVFAAICLFDDTPPEITCPGDITVECEGDGGIYATELTGFLDGATASDECTADPTITNDGPALFPVGTTVVTFTATDDNDNDDTCQASVTVEDTTPPEVTPPDPISLECNGPGGVAVSDPDVQAWLALATATDVCWGDIAVVGNDAPLLFPSSCPPGTQTTVTFDATDNGGLVGFAQSSVTVQDSTAPVMTCATAVDMLWPPNHKMVDVGLTFTATDSCDEDLLAIEVTVTSDEDPTDKGSGGRIHCPDAVVGPDSSVLLRAERSGTGDGRVYVITVSASDECGNVGTCQVSVGVPKGKKPGSVPVDSGQAFDAAVCGGM